MGRRILLTGATGFVGRYLAADLLARGHSVRAALRHKAQNLPAAIEQVEIGDLAGPVDWTQILAGIDSVVHSAGLAHADGKISDGDYDRVNTQATLALACATVKAGIRRFVFLSSIRAQSGFSSGAQLVETDEPRPTDAYGRSKLAAEHGLAALDLDWVALRPVLVYGPGVKANMAALLRLAQLPLPLPLAGLTEKRSILAIENLSEAIAFALSPACPARRAYIVADPEPVSVPGMIATLRQGLGREPGLFSVPPALLGAAAMLLGQGDRFSKLSAGLIAPPAALMAAGWMPPVTSGAGLQHLMKHHSGA